MAKQKTTAQIISPLGKVLSKYRKDHRYSKQQFANEIGISRPTIFDIENARTAPSLTTMITVANATGHSLDIVLSPLKK